MRLMRNLAGLRARSNERRKRNRALLDASSIDNLEWPYMRDGKMMGISLMRNPALERRNRLSKKKE